MDEQEFVMNFINAQLELMDVMRAATDPFPSPEADALEQELRAIADAWYDDEWGWAVNPQSINMAKALPLAQAWQESWYGRF